jgi:hypothetical protein
MAAQATPRPDDTSGANEGSDPDAQSTAGTIGDADPALNLDQVFEILKNERRRMTLTYLRQAEGQVSLSDLSEQLAAWENDKELRQITSSERKRVYVGLYQCHLPKMDGMGVVDFDKPRGTIEPGPNIERFYPYLGSREDAAERRWPAYFGAVSIVCAAGFAVGLPLETTTAAGVLVPWAGLSLVGFFLTSVYYCLDNVTGTAGDGDLTDLAPTRSVEALRRLIGG